MAEQVGVATATAQQPIGGSRTTTRGNALFGACGGRGVDSEHNRHRVKLGNKVMAFRAANLDVG